MQPITKDPLVAHERVLGARLLVIARLLLPLASPDLANAPDNPISRSASPAARLRSLDRRHNDLRASTDCSVVQRSAVAPNKSSRWGAILTGLLRCGVCGAAMGHVATSKGDRSYRYYACQTQQKGGAAACQGSRAPAAELDEVVTNRIRSIGSDPAVLGATLKATEGAGTGQRPDLMAEIARLSQQHKQLADQRRHLLDALQHGTGAATAISERLSEVDTQIATVAARQDEATTMLAAIDRGCIDEATIRTTLEEFEPLWDSLTPRERQRVLRLLIAEVRYDSQAGELEIDFRDNGIGEFIREVTNRKSA